MTPTREDMQGLLKHVKTSDRGLLEYQVSSFMQSHAISLDFLSSVQDHWSAHDLPEHPDPEYRSMSERSFFWQRALSVCTPFSARVQNRFIPVYTMYVCTVAVESDQP
jgi:hypothetical protein